MSYISHPWVFCTIRVDKIYRSGIIFYSAIESSFFLSKGGGRGRLLAREKSVAESHRQAAQGSCCSAAARRRSGRQPERGQSSGRSLSAQPLSQGDGNGTRRPFPRLSGGRISLVGQRNGGQHAIHVPRCPRRRDMVGPPLDLSPRKFQRSFICAAHFIG